MAVGFHTREQIEIGLPDYLIHILFATIFVVPCATLSAKYKTTRLEIRKLGRLTGWTLRTRTRSHGPRRANLVFVSHSCHSAGPHLRSCQRSFRAVRLAIHFFFKLFQGRHFRNCEISYGLRGLDQAICPIHGIRHSLTK
jgi:hypothetical protein